MCPQTIFLSSTGSPRLFAPAHATGNLNLKQLPVTNEASLRVVLVQVVGKLDYVRFGVGDWPTEQVLDLLLNVSQLLHQSLTNNPF